MDFKIVLLFITIFANSNAEYMSYNDYKVYKVTPETEVQTQMLIDIQKERNFMFWTDLIKIGSDAKIMVGPEKQTEFQDYLKNVGLEYDIVIQDVQSLIDYQMYPPSRANRNNAEYNWDYYQTLEEIYDWLQKIADEHSDVVTLVTIGTTVEDREIKGVKIDFKKQDNPTIGMFEGGIHAREWISPATMTWIINEFLTSTDPKIRDLAENIVWHIFPVTNPDGYVYTFTHNRLWRKNRNTAYSATCSPNPDMNNGVDLNRNFGFLWMTTGASSNPCDETYAGPTEFSELESVAISNYVNQIKEEGNLVYYFTFHSYSQLVLVPYSHVSGDGVLEAENYGDMYEITRRGTEALKQRHGTDYLVGTSADILYEVSGSSFDWVKGVANVPVVLLFELRDTGEHGFLLPTELIVDNNEEIMDALVEMDRVTRQMGYYSYNSGNSLIASVLVFLSLFIRLT